MEQNIGLPVPSASEMIEAGREPATRGSGLSAMRPPAAGASVAVRPSHFAPAATTAQAPGHEGGPSQGLRTTRLGRLGLLLLTMQFGQALPATAGGTLLQALLAEQRGSQKIGSFAVLVTIGAVGAILSTVVAGAWSDRTRSRFGRRNPWILGGAVVAATGLSLTGIAPSFPLQIVGWVVYQVGLSAMLAAVSALMPDRVAPRLLGRASALTGLGYLIGTAVGGIAAAAFITSPKWGLVIIPWATVAAALMLCLLARDRSSRDMPREKLSPRQLAGSLLPPRDKDFLRAFAGRFSVILSLYVVIFYQLYILTDFLHVSTVRAGGVIALDSVLLAVTAAGATVVSGLVSDRIGRRKPLVIAASLLLAAAALPLVIHPDVITLVLFSVIAGFGYGCYLAVDQALMVQVLPGRGSEAKQLGMLNIANTLPQVLGPLAAAILVTQIGFRALFMFAILAAVAGAICVASIRRVR